MEVSTVGLLLGGSRCRCGGQDHGCHTLVIPRERKAFLHELSDDACAAIGRALPRIARAVLAATGAEHYNVLQNNGAPAHQAVFHVHFHIIPKRGDEGLGIGWKPSALDPDASPP